MKILLFSIETIYGVLLKRDHDVCDPSELKKCSVLAEVHTNQQNKRRLVYYNGEISLEKTVQIKKMFFTANVSEAITRLNVRTRDLINDGRKTSEVSIEIRFQIRLKQADESGTKFQKLTYSVYSVTIGAAKGLKIVLSKAELNT